MSNKDLHLILENRFLIIKNHPCLLYTSLLPNKALQADAAGASLTWARSWRVSRTAACLVLHACQRRS